MRTDLISKSVIAIFLVLAALSFVGGFLRSPSTLGSAITGNRLTDMAAYGTPLVFICAAVLIFVKPRLGYIFGGLSGLIAILWFIRTNSSADVNPWICLNPTFLDLVQSESEFAFAKQRAMLIIAFAAATSTGAAASLLRLFPARWSLRGLPLSQRTWPAFLVGLLVMATWFVHSVMPYRVPIIVDAVPAELRILHVKKHSLHFEETAEILYRDGRFFANRSRRQLFRFDWQGQGVSGTLGRRLHDRVAALLTSQQLTSLHAAPAGQLWSWNAEGWYVVLKDSRLFSYTSEHQTAPPREIADLFYDILELPGSERRSWTMHDVCLGFCYGPVAALGFQYSNQSCFELARGASQCR